jgi:hypothetical protein
LSLPSFKVGIYTGVGQKKTVKIELPSFKGEIYFSAGQNKTVKIEDDSN